jgi:hypothetical protein
MWRALSRIWLVWTGLSRSFLMWRALSRIWLVWTGLSRSFLMWRALSRIWLVWTGLSRRLSITGWCGQHYLEAGWCEGAIRKLAGVKRTIWKLVGVGCGGDYLEAGWCDRTI